MNGLEIRGLGVEELEDLVDLEALVWGWKPDEGRLPWYRDFLEPAYTVGVFHENRLVATHGMTALRMTVPGGAVVDVGGFTTLVVHPLFRHRGLMSALTLHGFELARRAGLTVGGGIPIHSRTHLRYGYGYAARYAQVELDLGDRRSLRGVADDGRLYDVGAKTGLEVMHEVAVQLLGKRNGWVPRAACTNAYKYAGAERQSGAYGPMGFVVHRSSTGEPDGLLAYRQATDSDEAGRPRGTLQIHELLGVSADVEAQLWRFCMENPLVSRITATRRPVHDPVTDRLPEPRAWRQTVRDDLILCLLDVPAALAARRYARDDQVIVEVMGVPRPDAYDEGPAGRFALEGGLDGASCRATDATPDLSISLPALGSAYLGDRSLVDLAAAGHVVEHTPGGLRRADAMFSWSPAPWIQDAF